MRVIVTGSRTWRDPERVYEALDEVATAGDFTLVHGACIHGADHYAHQWYRRQQVMSSARVTEDPFPADWSTYGRSAGPIRNAEMVAAGADVVLAFADWCQKPKCLRPRPHMSHGTENCIQEAEKALIEVVTFWATDPRVES